LRYFSKLYEYGVEDLTDAIKLDQTCALAFYNRALCYHKLKDYRNALKDYGVVLLLGDYLRFKVLINRALLYFETKQYFNSLIDFKLASEFQQKDFNIKHMIGVCLHRLDRYQEAIAYLTEAYEINPNFHDALISRGNVFVDYGSPEAFKKAQLNYERVLAQNYKNVDAHINLAYLFQITGRFKMAWNQFSKAIEFDSSNFLKYIQIHFFT
jgi:tetratricopeptide (TPR) repeat protein